MEFAVKVVYKHFGSSALQSIPTRNLEHPVLSRNVYCASRESSCHADAEYLVKKAIGASNITESGENFLIKYFAILI